VFSFFFFSRKPVDVRCFLSPMPMKILDHFFPIINRRQKRRTIRFLFRSFWRALTTSGGPLLLS
jgi:hypothetical protein